MDFKPKMENFFKNFNLIGRYFYKVILNISDEAYKFLRFESKFKHMEAYEDFFKNDSFPQLIVLKFQELKGKAEPLSQKSLRINKSNSRRGKEIIRSLFDCFEWEDFLNFSKEKMNFQEC